MDFGNIIVLLSIIQSILLIALLIKKKNVQFPTQYLIFLLMGLLYFQFEFLLVRNAALLPTKLILLTAHGGWLMIGPLFYFLIKNFYEDVEGRKLLYHLLPFLIIAIIVPVLFVEDPLPKRGYHYGMLSVFRYSHLGLTSSNSFYGLVFFCQFIHLAIYIGFSYWYHQKQPLLNQSIFIKRLLGISLISYICCLIFYKVLLDSTIYKREWDYFLILPSALLVYFVSYVFLSKPELWRSDIKIIGNKKYERSELSDIELSSIKNQLDNYIKNQKPYLNPDLSLEFLSKTIGISRHKLSQVINREYNMSFLDYINQFRIAEAQKLIIEDKEKRSILSVAYEAGFNNKATFNKYFKKITGQTPSNFRKNKQSGKTPSD